MNEKIKQLANKAGISYLYDYSEDGHAVVCNLSDIEKLVGLILNECIERGNTLAKHYMDVHTERDQVMLLAAVADYSNEIKKHFGVGK